MEKDSKESCRNVRKERKIVKEESRTESMEENDFTPEAFSSSSASSSPPAPREEEAARAVWISCAMVAKSRRTESWETIQM